MDEILSEFRLRYDADPTDRKVVEDCLRRWMSRTGKTESELFDEIALRLASGFYSDELKFDFCSTFTRRLIAYEKGSWTPLLWDVYIAFDAGEFIHAAPHDGEPIETHTRPMIRAILYRQQGSPA